MQERRPVGRWVIAAVLGSVFALAAGTVVLSRAASARNDAPVAALAAPAAAPRVPRVWPQLRGAPNSDIVPSGARRGHARPPLADALLAARQLSDAGLLLPPAQPTLSEVLPSVAALARAGNLPPQPTMSEVLSAVRVLAAAGALPSAPGVPVAAPSPPAASYPPPPPPTPTAVPTAPAVAAPPPASPGVYDDAYSARILDLVNEQRAHAGLSALASEPRLTAAAGGYAKMLSDYNWFSHVGPDGSTFVSRIVAAGFPFTVQVGEVIAWGTEDWPPESIVEAWMNSPTHRAEVVSPVYTRAGVRCYFPAAGGATVYCVIEFAG